MNEQQKLWAKHAAEQLANVQNEHGIPMSTRPSVLSQATQFDGPMNSVIASYAQSAVLADYTYEEYVIYAQAYSTAAVLSEAEYAALAAPDENDRILVEHWDSNILFNQRNHTE